MFMDGVPAEELDPNTGVHVERHLTVIDDMDAGGEIRADDQERGVAGEGQIEAGSQRTVILRRGVDMHRHVGAETKDNRIAEGNGGAGRQVEVSI